MTIRAHIDIDVLLTHASFVRGLAGALLGGDGRVDDVVQETWLTALRREPRDPASLRAWLAGVVRNLAFTVRRRDAARRRRETAAAKSLNEPSAADIVEREDTRRRLIDAVLGLRDPYRTAVLLRYYEGLPPREIARRQGASVETVRTRVKRGLKLLRSRLDADHGGRREAWALSFLPLLGISGKSAGGVAVAGAHLSGALLMSTNVKLGFGILAIALLCAGVAVWQLGPSDPTAPPGEEIALQPAEDRDVEAPAPAAPPSEVSEGESAAPETTVDGSGAPPAEGTPRPGRVPPATGPPTPTREMKGNVRVVGTGNPLHGVTVTLDLDMFQTRGEVPDEKLRRFTTTTDQDGEYHFENILPGVYRVSFSHPNYAHKTLADVRVLREGELEGIVVDLIGDLETLGSVEGWVTGPEGDPRVGARLVVHSQEQGVRVETVTDEAGRYFVERLPAGLYRVSLLGEPKVVLGKPTEDLWSRVQFTAVEPQKTVRIDFAGTGTLTGTVLDFEGRPIAAVTVEVTAAGSALSYRQRVADTDAEGKFRIENAGQGLHHVIVHDKKQGWAVRTASVTLSGYDQELPIRVEEGEVSGRILLAEEKVPPASRRLYPGVLLHPPHPHREGVFGPHIALDFPDTEGKFRMKGIPAGTYCLRVHLEGFFLVEKMLEVRWGDKITDLELLLREFRTGKVRILVKDPNGKPAEGVIVSYELSDGAWKWPPTTRPGPGLYLSDRVEAGTRRMVLARADLKPKIITVEVVEGETAEVEATMDPK